MGGSVSISALIVGTTLIAIFALASLSLSESTKQAAEISGEVIREPDIRLLNASENSGTIHLNITNVGSESISYDKLWVSIDGETPIRVSNHFSSATTLFSGETQHLEITGTGITSPSRITAFSMGAHSAVAFS
ncbi:MAG: hypothetical protein VX320_00055 [Candidatus Thermoplasmatota archaeon]|nr:hypothetical protein [Candidatus Thermoplasmatota archaeon]